MAKKKRYQKPKEDEDEILAFKEHTILINKKIKAISQKYRKWWDKNNKCWKKGFSHERFYNE